MYVALIPVRGGSKSIPLKNIKIFCGKPLVYWTIKAAQDCIKIDKVYVSTDSEIIKKTVNDFGFDKVEVIDRSVDNSTDNASTESVMVEFAQKYEFNNLVLIQATSPLLVGDDLDKGIELFEQPEVDSVLSTVRQKRFYWKNTEGYVQPANYDLKNRPRRQEFDGYLVENGAFYIISRSLFLETNCRLAGKIKAVEMPEDTYFEIDEPSDWIILEELMRKRQKKISDIHIPEIKLFLTDSDGCLTDGGMYYSEQGDELKKFNTRDGMGFSLLKEHGILTGIITGENTELVRRRAHKLQLDIYKCGIKDKLTCVKQICNELNINLKNVAYIGDDINDLQVIENVGFGCCVSNAHNSLKTKANYITQKKGGEGAIREVIDLILNLRGVNTKK